MSLSTESVPLVKANEKGPKNFSVKTFQPELSLDKCIFRILNGNWIKHVCNLPPRDGAPTNDRSNNRASGRDFDAWPTWLIEC